MIDMKQLYTTLILLIVLLFVHSAGASAQIRGTVTDSITNEPLLYVTVQYEGKGVGAITNGDGEYKVETRKGWDELTFSTIGYVTKKVKIKPGQKVLNVKMSPDDIMLSEVVVKPKREKYSRKNNPAVDFMRKVIEHKKQLKLEENDLRKRLLPIPEVRKDEDVAKRCHPRKDGKRTVQEILLFQRSGRNIA